MQMIKVSCIQAKSRACGNSQVSMGRLRINVKYSLESLHPSHRLSAGRVRTLTLLMQHRS